MVSFLTTWVFAFLGYLALAAVLLSGSYGGIRLLGMAGVPPLWAKIPVECLLFLLSFAVQRNWIFFRRA